MLCSASTEAPPVAIQRVVARLHEADVFSCALEPLSRVVPLLLPHEHALPFAAAVHIHGGGAGVAPPPTMHQGQGAGDDAHAQLISLSYVLSGQGWLHTAGGEREELLPGDSFILMDPSAASVTNGDGTSSTSSSSFSFASAAWQQPGHSTWDEAAPAAAAEAGNGGGAAPPRQPPPPPPPQQQQQQQPLVTLQFLLPRALLQEAADHAACQAAAGAGAEAWRAGRRVSRPSPGLVGAALSQRGAGLSGLAGAAAQQHHGRPRGHDWHQQQQQQQHQRHGGVSSAQRLPHTARQQPERPAPHSGSSLSPHGQAPPPAVHKRTLRRAGAFKLPNQTNRLALLFGPSTSGLSLSFGLEVFEPGHVTPLHVHDSAHEVFVVLAGRGVGVEGDERFPLAPGDCVVFPPGVVHGVDNPAGGGAPHEQQRLFCLQLMAPNEGFVEFVLAGSFTGSLAQDELCMLSPMYC